MSILNVWVTPDRALIGVDTEGRDLYGNSGEIAKLFPLPHLNAVLAFRGTTRFSADLHASVASSGVGFDSVLDGLPRYLPVCMTKIRGLVAWSRLVHRITSLWTRRAMPDFNDALQQDVVFVGWSEKQQRVIGWQWLCNDLEVTSREISPYHIAPWADSLQGLPDPSETGSMARLIRQQCNLLRSTEPGVATGGRILIAELRRGSVNISSPGVL